MARNNSILRLHRVLHYLETTSQPLGVGEIVRRLRDDGFRVSRKTVYRDLDLLEQIHVPLRNEDEKWSIAPFAKPTTANLHFSYRELFALYVARHSLEHLRGTPFFADLESIFEKIEKLIGKDISIFQEMAQVIGFKPRMTWHNSVGADVLDTVYAALGEGHPLTIDYEAQSGPNAARVMQRQVGPECLYFAEGGVYLICTKLESGEVRSYALSRMRKAVMNSAEAYTKRGITPEILYRNSFGLLNAGEVELVQILLDGPTTKYLTERKWHSSQQIVVTERGSVLHLYLQVNDELVRWILGLGEAATVLAPSSLIDLVLQQAHTVVEKYRSIEKS